jgi:hypothetical protein
MSVIEIKVDDQELWSACFGSGYETDPVVTNWVDTVEHLTGDWDKIGTIKVTYAPEGFDDFTDGELSEKIIDQEVFLQAVTKMVTDGYQHCGHTMDLNTENWDVCVTDVILQLAVLGEYTFA